eukprot:3928679-Rhodomonas_salina.1
MASSQEEQSSNPPPASPRTQLLEACAADNAEDVRRLLAEKANPNEVDRNITLGVTILVIATSEGFSEVAAVLVEHGADVNACDKNVSSSLRPPSRPCSPSALSFPLPLTLHPPP